MRTNVIGMVLLLLPGFLYSSDCHANPVVDSKWRVVWFPPNDVLPSWNWVEVGGGNYNTMKIFPVDYSQKFPDEVKEWKLGVTPVNDPGKRVTVPLETPHWVNRLDFSRWMPGGIRVPGELRDSKIDRLEAMGEGTFLCAILGDGKRYSNVARVTIRHDYMPNHEPMIRLVGVQPFGENDPVKYIGAWFVAKSPPDPNLTTTALSCPAWEVNGTWRIEIGDPSGIVGHLPPEVCRAEVYYVGYNLDHPSGGTTLGGMGAFEPPIEAFTQAKVRLRIADRYNDFHGIPLTAKQRDYLRGYPSVDSAMQEDSTTSTDFKTYTSTVFDVHADKEAILSFDKAFGQ
jgi:hypothetical protein